MSERPIRGAWRAAALAAAIACPPWVPRPFRGGCKAAASLAGPRLSAGRGGWGWWGGSPRSPPSPRRPLAVAGVRPGGYSPGGPPANGSGALFPRPAPPFGCQTLVQVSARAPCSPGRGGGEGQPVLGAAARVSS